jgi:putative restriction endonuclease
MANVIDYQMRLAAFSRLRQLERLHGPILSWEMLAEGFSFENSRLLFANRARGIFRPAGVSGSGALSIKTVMPRGNRERRYDDLRTFDDTLLYRFQGEDPSSWDNRLLLEAHLHQLPLIYFYGVAPGQYQPFWPVFVHELDIARLRCEVRAGDLKRASEGNRIAEHDIIIERRYATRQVFQRLHQSAFRFDVLEAYEQRCAICRLPARALLEAAHITPDSDLQGTPSISNGISLCRLHHGAFDAALLGIRPDYVIEISPALLNAQDGPTLELGLKAFNGSTLAQLPERKHHRPDPERLKIRFAEYDETNRRISAHPK